MKKLLLYIWQLPQHILALLLLLYYRDRRYETLKYRGCKCYLSPKMDGGISLGQYIIVGKHDTGDLMHESGHSVQSSYLGPLYLLVIGLPSLIGNIYDRLFHTKERGWNYSRSHQWYYNQPWEKWADKLGGIHRQFNP